MSFIDSVERTARGCGVVLTIFAAITFTCGIFGLVYYLTTPEGEAVGSVPANGQSPVRVALSAGDALHFVVSYSHDTSGFGFFDGPSRDNAIERALRSSSMRVVAVPVSGGTSLEATCAPYNGRTGAVSEVGSNRSVSGGLTDCVIPVGSEGAYDVSSTITWTPELRMQTSSVEVRRAAPER